MMYRIGLTCQLSAFLVIACCVTGCIGFSSDAADAQEVQERSDNSYFDKVVLDENLNEPMQLDVFNDGRVVFIERYGKVKLYRPSQRNTETIAELEVNAVFSHGLLGVAIDPNYEENNWIYFFYSPRQGPDHIQRISRIQLINEQLLLDTEEVLLAIPVQREYHGHDGGALEFGPDGHLYIAVGDNVSPFMPDSRAPVDEAPSMYAFDAQGTSANTNDLRGKILRIMPEADGTYSVPDDNLFPEGMEKTRPEIYVMGARNPFRMSVDPKTSYLYWGNIGGVDEVHQVREAGFYGCWPYFYGDNQVYDHVYEYLGRSIDPGNPENHSPNNSGLTQIPPCREAFIWYSGEQFELTGGMDGGKSIMVGPVYYSDHYQDSTYRFPDYYDGKLFIYDWVRNWIITVEMDDDHEYKDMEMFLESVEFSSPMDMKFGPDGALYVLEYGSTGYAQNEDARLSRIEYARENRRPVAAITSDRTVGATPLRVHFSAEDAYDPDGGELTYSWWFDSDEVHSTDMETEYVFDEPGRYQVVLEVTDPHGATDREEVELIAGNEPPVVDIRIHENADFYWDNSPISYEVTVSDKEDGILGDGIDSSDVHVEFQYVPAVGGRGDDRQETGVAGALSEGEQLARQYNCQACHSVEQPGIGPSYEQIAQRYSSTSEDVHRLVEIVIEGGSGNWPGEQVMPPHPHIEEEEVLKIVEYILSHAQTEEEAEGIPLAGTVVANLHMEENGMGTYILRASYTDRGAEGAEPLTGEKEVVLRYPRIQAESYEMSQDVSRRNMYVDRIRHGAYIGFRDIDFTGIEAVTFHVAPGVAGGKIEMRLDDPEGKLISTAEVAGTGGERDWRQELYTESWEWSEVSTDISPVGGSYDLYLVFKNEESDQQNLFVIDWFEFQDERVTRMN